MNDHEAQEKQPRRQGCAMGCLTFLLALAALIVALAAWSGVPAPEWLRETRKQLESLRKPGAEPFDAENAMTAIQAKLQEARELVSSGEAREKAQAKYEEAQEMLGEFKDKAGPKFKEFLEQAKEKSADTLESIREGARESREKTENMVDSLDFIDGDQE